MLADAPPQHSEYLQSFLKLSGTTQKYIEKYCTSTTLPQGTLAITKGDPVAGAYIVATGQLRVFCHSSRGIQTTLYFINPGETCVFAINALFNDLRYPAWVEAETDTELLVIDGNTYKTLFRTEPAIQDLTINALSVSVYRLMHQIELNQEWSLKQRLINFLLNTASNDGSVTLTQQQISNHLGTSREVIARLLGELSAQSLIKTGRGLVQLKNTRELSELLIG